MTLDFFPLNLHSTLNTHLAVFLVPPWIITKMPTVNSKILITFTIARLFRTLDVSVDIDEHVDELVEYPSIFNNINIA